MRKTITFWTAVLALSVTLISAKGHSQTTAGRTEASSATGPVLAPKFCNNCLFYSGDYTSGTIWSNENDLSVPDSAVYIPFVVPSGQVWQVNGLGMNMWANDGAILDPNSVTWSISAGVRQGFAGLLIASGSALPAKPIPEFNFMTCAAGECEEFGVAILIPKLRLMAGTYWATMVPQCTNQNDSNCQFARFFTSPTSGANSIGEQPAPKLNYWNFPTGNDNFVPISTIPSCNQCSRFSIGVMGKSSAFPFGEASE